MKPVFADKWEVTLKSNNMNLIESKIMGILNQVLDEDPNGSYVCKERKSNGSSVLRKPVDFHISNRSGVHIVGVEVANVNTTQLVGEVARLYFDTLPLKLLVLHAEGNVRPNGKSQCEKLFCRLYGQDEIGHTPARVVWDDKVDQIRTSLKELLLIS